ncbi:MAG: DUF4399 domain-containing protein [Lysobacterales bacterium]
MKLSVLLLIALLFTPVAFADAEEYFISPQDGDTVSGTFEVRFGLKGMGVAPAGVDMPNTGHHHLLIDMDSLPPMDAPLPKSDQLLHFGGGQTETTLSLPPGQHTLQLILANYAHVSFDPPLMSQKITITVTE